MASQLFGTRWDGGHAMLAYEFSDATPLDSADRLYAANADKTPYGGGNYDSYYSNPGNILDPMTEQPAYGIPPGQDGKALSAAGLSTDINLANPFAQAQIFPETIAHEVYASGSQSLGSRVRLFAQGRFTRRSSRANNLPDEQILVVPPTNPFYVNPFSGVPYTLEAYSFARDLGPTVFASRTDAYMATLGASFQLPGDWQTTLSESYGRQTLLDDEYNVPDPQVLAAALADPNPLTAFDPFGDGAHTNSATIAAIRRDFRLRSASGIESTSLVADGSLLKLPAGEVKLAVGVERREETLDHDVPDPTDPDERTVPQRYVRHVTSAFSQLVLPLVGDPHEPRAAPSLELSLSARHEHYSDFGNTFNPMADLRWTPLQALKLRGSWGRSFRAPKLDDLYDTAEDAAASLVLPDPKSPSGRSLVLVEQGSNPRLRQETAKTWTAGLDLAPPYFGGSTLSLTYYSIDYDNRIALPAAGDPFDILVRESEWASVITRAPSQAQVAALCESPVYQGSVSSCLLSAPAAIVDARLANLATTRTSGIDFEVHQLLHGRGGNFQLGLMGNYVLQFAQAVTAGAPPTSILDTTGNPLALRMRGTLAWTRHGLGQAGPRLALAVNYLGAYRNPGSTLLPRVAAWTTLDLQAAYALGRDGGWLRGTQVTLNAVNVLNHDPPFVDSQFGYDIYNVQALGRVVSLDIRKAW
jgi:outer membrane receptor protein involved in Fe transport